MKQFLFFISCVPKKILYFAQQSPPLFMVINVLFYRQVNNWPDFNTSLMNKSAS